MAKIQLITENYIKNNSPVTWNVQVKDLSSHVDSAQDIHLRVILGDSFMEDIKDKFKAQNLNPEEVDLVQNYIQPALLWRTLALAAPFMQYNLRTKGYVENTDDNGNSIEFAQLKYIINNLKNRAEVHENLLQKYLSKHSIDFPEFKEQTGLTPPNADTSFDSGLIFY